MVSRREFLGLLGSALGVGVVSLGGGESLVPWESTVIQPADPFEGMALPTLPGGWVGDYTLFTDKFLAMANSDLNEEIRKAVLRSEATLRLRAAIDGGFPDLSRKQFWAWRDARASRNGLLVGAPLVFGGNPSRYS